MSMLGAELRCHYRRWEVTSVSYFVRVCRYLIRSVFMIVAWLMWSFSLMSVVRPFCMVSIELYACPA